QPGDEVIVPAFTYVATAEVISLLKLKPVFAEVLPNTFNLDIQQLESKISSSTKAIMVVHLFGQCADMEPLLALAEKFQISVIEDNAQALGAVYTFSDGSKKYSGTMGTIGTTSFFPTKNLGTYGDGGAMFAQDEHLSATLRQIANHGQKQKYYHEILGVNSRLDTLHAAILSVKLKYLPEYEMARKKVASFYDRELSNLPGIEIPVRNPSSTHVFHQYTLRVKNNMREKFRTFLSEKGIPTMVYYPLPQHLQKACEMYGYKKGDFPISEKLSEEVCSLPIHTELKQEELEYITQHIKSFFK
ncbi:MAG: DegT/DnrJ/EryC1/StrS family aminotransferase, partial [Cyclobacteriaceae bacterium]|nr:DegT/DnrJ/EryC1/StrS family aminotransferase [Cyclobacteriaceae bacterium]